MASDKDSSNRQLAPFKESKKALEELDSFFHEINLLKIEGQYFCFDPKGGTKGNKENDFWRKVENPEREIERQRVSIIIHPHYGRPAILAYKVYEAIFKKLSDYGYPVPEAVSFSYRELARLIDHRSFGGTQHKQLQNAIKQLLNTEIEFWGYDKESQQWGMLSFRIITNALFSGNRGRLTECCVKLDPLIIRNLNRHYSFCLNFARMSSLEPIAAALYKRLFFHFSTRYSNEGEKAFPWVKDYATICKEWLGGLAIKRYKSKVQEQLGPHLDAIINTGLIQRFDIFKNSDSSGFNFIFYPGKGFFEDYENFYVKHPQIQIQFSHTTDEQKIQKPLELVAYFYERLYGNQETQQSLMFSVKETEFAAMLLQNHSFEEAKELVDYALTQAPRTKFEMRSFGAIRTYLKSWLGSREDNKQRKQRELQLQQDAQAVRLRERYEAFRRSEIAKLRESLPPEELKRLEGAALAELAKENPNPITLRLGVTIKLNALLAERYPLPSFEEWSKEQV